MFKDSLEINSSICDTFKTFELMDVRLRSLECIRILLIYRPPDNASCAPFYEEFSRLLERVFAEHPGRLLILGDLNFHVDDPGNSHATQFKDILEAFNLRQLVKGATHANGHTLDLLITTDDSLVKRVMVRDPAISDHYAVHCDLCLQKPQFAKKVVNFRKLRSIDMDSLREDILSSSLVQQQAADLDTLVGQYERCCAPCWTIMLH